MKKISLTLLICLLATLSITSFAQDKTQAAKGTPTIAEKIKNMQAYEGFFNFFWDEKGGKIWLEIKSFDQEILYVNSLQAGVGSNDIGLDRKQLGGDRVIKFVRSGPKVLMVQPNYNYRAVSDNERERQSVEEAFAQSVLWGFKVAAESDGKVLVDFTDFLLRDAHDVSGRLKQRKQGSYKVDASRSAIYLDNTKNFPKNSEFEAMVTLTGVPSGNWIRSVTPTAESVTVRTHHSLVELPDSDYSPRIFDPRSGYYPLSYKDYATPIDQPLDKRFIYRHRLKKKNPGAAKSEAVEPIVYYLDPGAPEPIKSALIEGASWWNEAFEAAGFINAFQVKVLPEGADPMDVRYNMINWVHRSTRGWSYGSSVSDPRTGEIIKGHVLLGSLRVRQDFLIAQGMVEAYTNGKDADPRMLEMALARLRQLSAHEVGHTLGLTHNFAASVNDRASVMDYPHPYITLDANGELDFSQAYDVGIGDWDKRTIIYGYQEFAYGANEAEELQKILKENNEKGFDFISDQDARPAGGAHPLGHLWDNGQSPITEMNRLMKVRKAALEQMSAKNIPEGAPMATLENVLVPLYLAHRYQVEAVSKLIGGVHYTYAANGDGQKTNEMVSDKVQKSALEALLGTLDPEFLAIPEDVIALIPPQPIGYNRGRELFKNHTGLTFDPIGAAESAANHTISFLLNAQRLTRIVEQSARDKDRMGLYDFLNEIVANLGIQPGQSAYEKEIARMVEKILVQHLIQLAADRKINQQVSAMAGLMLEDMKSKFKIGLDRNNAAHNKYILNQIKFYENNPEEYKVPSFPSMPDGSPIGNGMEPHLNCGGFH
jgi:hypothetical protein